MSTCASLPAMDVVGRAARLRERLTCDALLVTSLVHIRYLTGFTGSAALLLVLPDELVLVTDGRYAEQSREQLAAAGVDARVEIAPTAASQRDLLRAAVGGVRTLGLEAEWVTWAQQGRYAAEWFPETELVPTEHLVESLRREKDDGEVARIEAAARIADESLAALVDDLVALPLEREFALTLDAEMRRRGATGPSFETIVASGPNAAKPHHRPASRQLRPGEPVVIDFGAMVDGYCSDMTRTVCVGDPADDTVVRMRDVVARAQAAGVAAVGPGVAAVDVDRACREVIAGAGFGEAFVHGTGHGVGLQIHEDPRVSSSSSASLQVGDVVTVEPGVYLPGVGGVRIEDTVLVTPTGCRPLTTAPKGFVVRP